MVADDQAPLGRGALHDLHTAATGQQQLKCALRVQLLQQAQLYPALALCRAGLGQLVWDGGLQHIAKTDAMGQHGHQPRKKLLEAVVPLLGLRDGLARVGHAAQVIQRKACHGQHRQPKGQGHGQDDVLVHLPP